MHANGQFPLQAVLHEVPAVMHERVQVEAAAAIGKLIAEKAKKAGVTSVAFDRSGYKYHGRIKALADAARENGLSF